MNAALYFKPPKVNLSRARIDTPENYCASPQQMLPPKSTASRKQIPSFVNGIFISRLRRLGWHLLGQEFISSTLHWASKPHILLKSATQNRGGHDPYPRKNSGNPPRGQPGNQGNTT